MTPRAVLVFTVAVVASVLAVGTVHEVRHGADAVDRCDAALAKSDRAAAIAAARQAAESVAPGSPYPERGYRRLESIAKDAEAHGDDETARSAWSAMRAAALETRGPLVRTAAWLAEANDGIARVGSRAVAGEAPRTPAVAQRPPAAAERPWGGSEQSLLRELHRTDTPTTFTFMLLAAGAAAFFAGLGQIAWRAGSRLVWREVRLPTAIAAAGLAVYLFATLR